MVEEHKGYHYKVEWRFKGPKERVVYSDYWTDGVKRLLSLLEKAEGATPANTDFMIIHQVDPKTGNVTELNMTGDNVVDVDFNAGKRTRKTIATSSVELTSNRGASNEEYERWWGEQIDPDNSTLPVRASRTLDELDRILRESRGEPAPVVVVSKTNSKPKVRVTLTQEGTPYVVSGMLWKTYDSAREATAQKRKPNKKESPKYGVEAA